MQQDSNPLVVDQSTSGNDSQVVEVESGTQSAVVLEDLQPNAPLGHVPSISQPRVDQAVGDHSTSRGRITTVPPVALPKGADGPLINFLVGMAHDSGVATKEEFLDFVGPPCCDFFEVHDQSIPFPSSPQQQPSGPIRWGFREKKPPALNQSHFGFTPSSSSLVNQHTHDRTSLGGIPSVTQWASKQRSVKLADLVSVKKANRERRKSRRESQVRIMEGCSNAGETLADRLKERLRHSVVATGNLDGSDSAEMSFSGRMSSSGELIGPSSPLQPTYATEGQLEEEKREKLYVKLSVVHNLWFTIVSVFFFIVVPLRIAIGKNHFHVALEGFEYFFDVLLWIWLTFKFILPRESAGRLDLDRKANIRHYLKHGFAADFIAAFPLYIILLPLHAQGEIGDAGVDFARVNRLLFFPQFSVAYDFLTDTVAAKVHPTAMRIIKFSALVLIAAEVCAAPIFMLIRYDRPAAEIWLRGLSSSTATAYLKTYLMTLMLVSGRNYEYPYTDEQNILMLFLALFGLVSTVVIIAGVTSMVLTMVERSSTLSNKLDDVIMQLRHQKLPTVFQEEVVNYYHQMYSLFNTFDYTSEADQLDDLPEELRNEIHDEISVSTIKQIPLFADVTNDVEFVRAMSTRLVMHLLMPGVDIVVEGEEGEDMFFLSKGQASVYVCEAGSTPVASLKQGAFFGEQTVLFGGVRTATITTDTLCQVYALSRESFEELIDVRPDALEAILKVTLQRQTDNDKAAQERSSTRSAETPSNALDKLKQIGKMIETQLLGSPKEKDDAEGYPTLAAEAAADELDGEAYGSPEFADTTAAFQEHTEVEVFEVVTSPIAQR